MKKILVNFSNTILLGALLVACMNKEKKEKKSAASWSVSAPDSALQASVSLNSGKLTYVVLSGKDTVIKTSDLGISRADQSFIDSLSFVEAASVTTIDEKYTLISGKRKENRNYAKELTLTFKNNSNSKLQVIFRAYNDGIAFRYKFPETDSSTYTVTKEISTFAIPSGKTWIQPYGVSNPWGPSYEEYYSTLNIGTNSPDSSGWSFPALFNTEKNWILLTEAALDETYFGARLAQNSENGVYKIRLPAAGDGEATGVVKPSSTLPWATPWRTLIIGKSAGALVESNLVSHLANPQVSGDFSWVKPGRASWSWWSETTSCKDFKRLKDYVDLAKEFGWEYSLVDANWNIMGNGGTIEDLARYANTKGVGLSLWYNSGGPNNAVTEMPRDVLHDDAKRKAEFKRISSWGVKAVKIDFFHSDKQNMIKYYLDILKDAAEAHLLVDFHGCTLPRGWSRTYPNLLTMEAVRGAELYGFNSGFPKVAPSHNNILPYTRNVVGPMDYTPVTFGDIKFPHLTTNAHELALSVLYETGILHFADKAETYKAQSPKVQEFLKIVPVTWDDVKFVTGEPAKLTVLARQKGDSWFVAGINGDSTAKEVDVQLPFITGSGYKLTLYADGADNHTIEVKESDYATGSPINVKMLSRGGFTAWIRK